jgi:hypothetical protein
MQLEAELQLYNLEETDHTQMDKQILDKAILVQEKEQQQIGIASSEIATGPSESHLASVTCRLNSCQQEI